MRILAIRGERLASLHEPFEVDFDQAPLAGAGLFAITGPTGAGKSTLLDAVCLALYGDTPRVHGNGGADIALGLDEPDKDQRLGAKDPRHLLSRGSKRGHAEVDFRGQDGVRYRARWSVEPRPKIGDLDAADMSLVRIADGQVLAKGPTATRREVIRQIGFTFEEFQKAVLLPQGQFAEFLRASAKTRSDILEKVAGGEIYSRLGTLAAARQGAEGGALERIEAEAAGHHPLADAERAATTGARDAAAAEIATARKQEQAAREALAWHDAEATLTGGFSEAEIKLARTTEVQAAAAPRRAELEAVERALSQRDALASAIRAEAALASSIEDLEKKFEEAREATRGAEEAESKVAGAEAARAGVEAEIARSRPEIEDAKRLDAELGPARRAEEDAAQAELTAAGEARSARADVTNILDARLKHEAVRDEVALWFSARAGEMAVVAEWSRWREVIQRHGAAFSAAQAARKRRDAAVAPEAVEQARIKALEEAKERDRALVIARGATETRDAAEVALREAEERCGVASSALQRARDAQGLEARRAELVTGEPCPLCGAKEHPWAGRATVDAMVTVAAEAARGCEAGLAVAKVELTRTRAAADQAGKAAATRTAVAEGLTREADTLEKELARAGRAAADAELTRAEEEAKSCLTALAAPFDGVVGWREALTTKPAQLLADWDGRAKAHAQRRETRDQIVDALAKSGSALAGAEAKAREKGEAAEAASARLCRSHAEMERLAGERAQLLGGRPAAEVEGAYAERLRGMEQALDAARKGAATAGSAAAGAVARQGEAARRQASAETGARGAAQALATALASLEVDRDTLQQRVSLGDRFVAEERRALAQIESAERDARTLVEERRRAVDGHAASRPALQRPAAEATLETSAEKARVADAHRIEAEALLVADAKAQAALAALGPRLEAQRTRTRLAAQLGALIGQTGNKSFRAFAQGLALDSLLVHANGHLEQLAPRYRLSRIPGHDMELQVLDQDLGGAARAVNSLSGGETFLVSLGLALGLSGLATRAARVESLFVDEGFGSLDPETLDQAMEVLEGLRAAGRTVGIVSHVPELHDRIGVLIQVEKIGAGRSRVRAVRTDETKSTA